MDDISDLDWGYGPICGSVSTHPRNNIMITVSFTRRSCLILLSLMQQLMYSHNFSLMQTVSYGNCYYAIPFPAHKSSTYLFLG